MPVEAMMWLNFVNRDSGVPNFPLLPRVAWEKVPEGRMRALCLSSINMSDSFCYKNPPRRSAGRQEEPSPGLRPPSPIASRRARGNLRGQTDCVNFPRTILRKGEGKYMDEA